MMRRESMAVFDFGRFPPFPDRIPNRTAVIGLCLLVAALLFLSHSGVSADASLMPSTDIKKILHDQTKQVQHLASLPILVNAVRKQNSLRLSMAEITALDQQWKASSELTPFKLSLQKNPAGVLLKRIIQINSAIFNEAFLVDNQGANVAAYPATSDYWQGDEAKWIQSFANGYGEVFFGPLEMDESTGVKAIQISVPVKDGDEAIGVLIMGVKLSHISSLKLQFSSE